MEFVLLCISHTTRSVALRMLIKDSFHRLSREHLRIPPRQACTRRQRTDTAFSYGRVGGSDVRRCLPSEAAAALSVAMATVFLNNDD
ncbi:hypothetical protein BU25DRAFT_209785 [Macroventuria anomochaeta]|uniref:Uncharacterized protein n=1 Tax=Macroventuria anomochaeta TaxID=301207 RepID=A0ACB6RM77_9PLEO|nr:uncharacterized protein BU25DRAFT_209785 [Macroventuria anomochaeta]KAF2622495.1 hypothetical protein BU25DRAFT_209785 [Macroventuria anomochaeta]